MHEYVATSGQLRTFEHLYDKKLDRLPGVGEFETWELTNKGASQRTYLASHLREGKREWAFLMTFFDFSALGKAVIYGIRDVEKAMGAKVAQRLEKAQEMPHAAMKYFTSDDDLVITEIKQFREQMKWVNDLYPPTEGNVFWYVSDAAFDKAEAYWRSAAAGSARSREDPFRRDFFWLATESPLLITIDNIGTIAISYSPKKHTEEKIKKCISVSARSAGMEVNFAPGLFG